MVLKANEMDPHLEINIYWQWGALGEYVGRVSGRSNQLPETCPKEARECCLEASSPTAECIRAETTRRD